MQVKPRLLTIVNNLLCGKGNAYKVERFWVNVPRKMVSEKEVQGK